MILTWSSKDNIKLYYTIPKGEKIEVNLFPQKKTKKKHVISLNYSVQWQLKYHCDQTGIIFNPPINLLLKNGNVRANIVNTVF